MTVDVAGDVYLECLSPVALLASVYLARLSLPCCCGAAKMDVTRRSLQLVSVLVSTIFGTSVLLLSAWGRPFRLLALLPIDLLVALSLEYWSLEFAWSLVNPVLLQPRNVHELVAPLMMVCVFSSVALRSQTCLLVAIAEERLNDALSWTSIDKTLADLDATQQRLLLLGSCAAYWYLRMLLLLGAHRPPLRGVEHMVAPLPNSEIVSALHACDDNDNDEVADSAGDNPQSEAESA